MQLSMLAKSITPVRRLNFILNVIIYDDSIGYWIQKIDRDTASARDIIIYVLFHSKPHFTKKLVFEMKQKGLCTWSFQAYLLV